MVGTVNGASQSAPENRDGRYEDVVSQFPFLYGYTHALRGFELSDDTPREDVIKALRTAFEKVKSEIPWLAGQVIRVAGDSGSSAAFRCAPWPADAPPNDVIRVKDCSDLFPPFAEIVQAGGPVSMLDGRHLEPWPGLPLPPGISPAPVVSIQTNFIKGGVLLVMSLQHNMIDASGILQFTELMATVMAGKEIPADAIANANRDRARVIPLLAPGEPIKDHSFLRRPADMVIRMPQTEWCVFRLPLSALPTLKALATEREGWDDSIPFISTNDALSAFCWKRIAAVRLANGRLPDQVSKFGRAIDARRVMGVPPTYLGQMVYHAGTWLPLGTVATAPLPTIACALRRSLNEANTEWSIRSYATFLAGEADKSRLMYGGPWNPDTDVGASSPATAMLGYQPVRLGLLGESKFFRKPNGPSIPGCLYLINPDNDKTMPIILCLTREDLDGLKNDPEWTKYVECVG